MLSNLELIFRKITDRHYAVIGVGESLNQDDTWQIWGLTHNNEVWMGEPKDPSTLDLEDIKRLGDMDAPEILSKPYWPGSAIADPVGGCILRPTSKDGLVFFIGAIDAPTPLTIELECVHTVLPSGKLVKKETNLEPRGCSMGYLFRQCVWTNENIGFSSTFRKSLNVKADELRALGLTTYKALGKEALQVVYQAHNLFISDLALGSFINDEEFAKVLLKLPYKKSFSRTYTAEEDKQSQNEMQTLVKEILDGEIYA